ncbi:MAG: LysM peptidoglycan-binding domain-containing protein [Mucilaginibacter sp.]
MTLQEIYELLNANIHDGTLTLSPGLISSPEIDEIFKKYLLDKDLVIKEAKTELNTTSVTVNGKGDSLIFFSTIINTLTFTVSSGVPSMAITAYAIVKDKDGWTFGRSFPAIKNSNWGGFFNPAKPTEWIQYMFFYGNEDGTADNPVFTLDANGLMFTGYLMLTGMLESLAFLFNTTDRVQVTGSISLNTGKDGYVADVNTAVPVMKLVAAIGTVTLPLGSLPAFTLEFSLNATATNLETGDEKGRPVSTLEILIESTMPIETIEGKTEDIGVAIVVATQSSSLSMGAIMPETIEVGISEMIALANNENLLAIMPSNIPFISDFILVDWQLVFETKTKTITQIAITTATRSTFSWQLIPGFIRLTSIEIAFAMLYLNGRFDPSVAFQGTITIGTGDSAVNFMISASFPSYVFMGALDPATPVDLRGILIYLMGEGIANSLPDTLKLGILNIVIDPKNTTYSLETSLTTDLEIPVVITTITVTTVSFNINYVAGVPTGNIIGEFKVGKKDDEQAPEMFVSAAYNGPEEGWVFSGGLSEGSNISLKYLIETYLPEAYHGFDVVDITITSLLVTFNLGQPNSYSFKLGAKWQLDLGLDELLVISGLTEIDYTPTSLQPYKGYIQGEISFGNILVKARVDFKGAYNDYLFILNNVFEAKLTHNTEGDSIICFQFTTETSLGDMIAWLVGAATGEDITLTSPWNVMNNIKLKDFGFSFNITKNKIGLSYRPSINLGFIDIKEITLYYTYYPNDPNKKPLVEIAITEGSFLGGAMPLPQPWNVLEPEKAPAVPGQGENLFRLEFLGLGQHVSLKDDQKTPDSVAKAVDLLKAAFETTTAKPTNPIAGTGLKFNSSSNWLIGTQFVIVDSFAIGIVFFDPDLYGLSLYANGPKAKVFQGLKFEILYKKVSDTVGVYQVYLKLPDAIRQIDFGAVSVTLPSIKIYIYTNGDFKIDLGFPANDNFSESFSLQMLPFIGSGGFYFGMLSAETAGNVPAATNGNFSPVIVFGLGLRVGVGKEINKGILKAGISIVVQGILEGTFAQFNYYDTTIKDSPAYYYILGKLSIVGHVYGAVNFLIISAEVDLKVFVAARIVFQSYEPILINLSAGVSVSLKVRINLGIFSISISLSFSTTIEFSFTIGSKQPTPWINSSMYATHFRQLSLTALDDDTQCPVIPPMNFQPVIPPTKVELQITYIPQFTAATDDTNGQKARAVAMLYLESSVDQPSAKKSVVRNGVAVEEDYPFNKFAKGAFLWVLGAYFSQPGDGVPVQTILDKEISITDLNKIICYFSQDDLVEPFTLDDVYKFMAGYLDATVIIPPRTTEVVAETSVSVLPMLPNLIFETPGGDIYFSNEKAQYTYDQEQLRLIHQYFNELAVRNGGDDDAEQQLRGFNADDEEQSLATFMLIDYMSLLAKESCQKGIDRLTALGYTVGEGESIDDIVNNNANFGISAIELAHSNRTRALRGGTKLSISQLNYTVKHQDTLELLSSRFNVEQNEILRANTYLRQQAANPCSATAMLHQVEMRPAFGENNTLIPGATVVIPRFTHVTSAGNGSEESLLSVARRYGIDVLSLIAENTSVAGLFPAGKKILVPFAESMTVADLIAAMDENNDFEQLSGLSANIMLQGLRVPVPEENSEIGEPKAMYEISGQQIDASALAIGQQLTLKLETSLDWLGLGAKDGTELPFTLLQEDIDALAGLADASLKPDILELAANPLFDVQPRKFSLPNNITWQSPAPLTLANGANGLQDTIDPSIWAFPDDLNALLNGYDAIAPKVQLLKQVQETKTKTGKPEPIADYSWSTTIDVRLTQVRSAEDPTQLMPNVYELQGIDQASMGLLRNLLEYYGQNPGTNIIKQIDVLYSKEPAKEGQTEPPSGLMSNAPANTSMYLLQTNLSTLSNPPQSVSALKTTTDPGVQENLLGMTQIDFLKYAWEAAVVGTGGYYFYYLIKDSKNGLPEYLFNGNTDNIITLVVTYNITNDVLLNFLNSAVIRDPINIQDEILYVETLEQTVEGITPGEKDTLQQIAKRYGTSVSKIAVQNVKAVFRQGARLNIPAPASNANQLEYTAVAAETLESVAEKHSISIIALAHANKNVGGLFTGPLTFNTRIEVKVATVPPGNIGFAMKRKNPAKVDKIEPAELNLQQLYNLLGYNIGDNDDFNASVPGLPVAPGDHSYVPPSDLDNVERPSAADDEDYLYDRIVPVYPFVKTMSTQPVGDVPPEQENPYRAVGKTVQIDMRWQDIFGNLTSFTNVGETTVLPPQKIGYIDPVIGISLYPSVSASYIVEKNSEDTPALSITLAFNPTSYVPVEAGDLSWRQRATTDREAYKQIYYQLIQEDMKVSISNSLEGTESISAVESTAKETLINMVLAIYQYLGEILAAEPDAYVFYTVEGDDETLDELAQEYGTTPQNIRRINPSIPLDGKLVNGETIIVPLKLIPADQIIDTPVSDKNPESLFALVTSITLSRDLNLVDDNFKDEPSVLFSTSVLGPNLKKNSPADNSNSITIQQFAEKLQDAFPELKAASGTPQIGVQDDSAIEIWVVRFNDSATGIQFSVTNSGNPFYFALLPLSTHLMSRDKVKIYPYVSGTPIWEMTPGEAAFNGIDIEKLAQTCLAAIDTFLQADFAIPAWQVENGISEKGDKVPYPYQSVIDTKKTLADNIVKHMATVLEDGNVPGAQNLQNAQERLKQELLISLSNAYAIDTVLQFNVDVTSQYKDPEAFAPNLFGKVVDPNNTTQTDQQAYAFSTTRFSLENSDGSAGDQSYLTILFNSKKENNLHLESGFFPIDLQYQINSVEHNIQEVTSIDGYKSSSWLTFILPFNGVDTELGSLKIPVPLRAYPTSPSLTAQTFSTIGQDALQAVAVENKLEKAKQWNYSYTYDYLRADQDTINTDVILNVPLETFRAARFTDEEDPDLFAALLQFSSAYTGIQRDFAQYLLDQSNPEYAYTAMQSFAWLAGRVAGAWGKWQENQSLYGDMAAAQAECKYEIVEGETTIKGETEEEDQLALLIKVTSVTGTGFQIPEISISGFKTDTLVDEPGKKHFAYYTENNGERTYLSPADGKSIAQRNVGFSKFNIINQENVWSGISVIRNKILVPGIETNTDFIYTTPTIRFVSVLTPLLDPDIIINIADYTTGEGKQPLQLYLSNFLQQLFIELAGQTTTRQIKFGINYSYNIQEGIDGLRTEIPVSITTPLTFDIPADWDTSLCPVDPDKITPDSTIVCQLTALIEKWFSVNNPVTTNAQFNLDISLFASLSATQLPVLRLRNLYLNEKDIQWN